MYMDADYTKIKSCVPACRHETLENSSFGPETTKLHFLIVFRPIAQLNAGETCASLKSSPRLACLIHLKGVLEGRLEARRGAPTVVGRFLRHWCPTERGGDWGMQRKGLTEMTDSGVASCNTIMLECLPGLSRFRSIWVITADLKKWPETLRKKKKQALPLPPGLCGSPGDCGGA